MSNFIKIIADDKIPFLKGVLEPYAHVTYLAGKDISPANISEADVLIVRTRTECNEELLTDSNVQMICSATIGYDHIDTEYCDNKGIVWKNAPGCNSSSVMQYIGSALFAIADENQIDLREKTIGIVGVGNVGKKVKDFCEKIGMKVLLNDPPRSRSEGNKIFLPLEEVIERSDIITLHVPLNYTGADKTYHLCDSDFFSKCSSKILINTSRGPVVEQLSFIEAARSGRVIYSVFDVWEEEPYISPEMFDLVNIATPHIAGYSLDGKANGTSVCVNEISNHFKLPLKSGWYPEVFSTPEIDFSIEADCNNKNLQEVLKEIIHSTYNIRNDDEALRTSPGSFEKLRENYPVRREFHNYSLRLLNSQNDIIELFSSLGFKIDR